tara:strand:- start:4120 stop:4590 length:471 start_codon:yes stop_codon:yes gene_type:complete
MNDIDEKVDARTVEEDMETRNNMTWLNNRVVELEAEVKRLREENEFLREELQNDDRGTKAIDGLLNAVGDRNEEVKRLREENDFLRSISSRDAIEAHGKPVNWMLRKLMFDDCIKAGINRRTAYCAAMGYMMMESGRWTPPKQGPYADIFNGDEEE